MSRLEIPVYIDFKSPYAFLSVKQARAMALEYGADLDWRPYNLPLADFMGALDTRNDHQWRRVKYSYMDCRRLANQRGMTILGPRKLYDSTIASIALLYAKRAGPEVADAFIDHVFERFFRRELDIEDEAAVTAALAAAGADADGFAAFRAGEGAEAFRALVEEAHENGVFGTPSFLFDGELFWGAERLDLLKERLRARPPARA